MVRRGAFIRPARKQIDAATRPRCCSPSMSTPHQKSTSLCLRRRRASSRGTSTAAHSRPCADQPRTLRSASPPAGSNRRRRGRSSAFRKDHGDGREQPQERGARLVFMFSSEGRGLGHGRHKAGVSPGETGDTAQTPKTLDRPFSMKARTCSPARRSSTNARRRTPGIRLRHLFLTQSECHAASRRLRAVWKSARARTSRREMVHTGLRRREEQGALELAAGVVCGAASRSMRSR